MACFRKTLLGITCGLAALGPGAPTGAQTAFPTHLVTAPGAVLTNIAQYQALTSREAAPGVPVRFELLVAAWDKDKHTVLVRDNSGVMEIALSNNLPPLKMGRMVRVEAIATARTMVRYPDLPSSATNIQSLEMGEMSDGQYVSRYRGWVYPPATGDYTFWVSSDDESSLLLSKDESPENARQIGAVTNHNTQRYAWDEEPEQQSEKMLLQAQQPYYIEVLHRNIGGPSFLSVAWEGPGLAQAVIGGQYLAPWLTGVARAAPGTAQRGTILHECWLALGTTFRDLGTGPSVLSSPELTSLKVTDLGEQGVATRHIQPGEPFPAEPDYCWAEVEGQVTAVSELEDAPLLELTQGDRRMTLKLEERPEGGTLSALLGAKVHAEGACVSALDPHGHRVAELLRVPDLRHIELREVPHVPLTPLHELEKGASFEGQRVRVCGRVVEMSEDGFRVEEGGSRFFAYVSTNGTDWDPVGDMSVPLEQTGVVGLAVLSHTNGTLTEAAFSKAEWLGENWQHTDIDTNTAPQGQVRLGSDGGVVKGGGSDINHDTQQFHYVWRTNTGDATLVVRVDSLLNTHEWAKAGIMFRDRPEVNSRYAALFITPDTVLSFNGAEQTRGIRPSCSERRRLRAG